MTREKKNSDWDDLQIMLNSPSEIEQEQSDSAPETSNGAEPVETQASENVPGVATPENAEPEPEPDADLATPESDDAQETPGDESVAEKKEKKSAAKNAEKEQPEAKKARATRAAKKDSVDEVKPAPKRARGRRSAASEKELEVSKTFGDVISQIASVAQGKRASKKSAPVETELNVESPVEVALSVEVETPCQEPTVAPECDAARVGSEDRGANETLFATFIEPQPEDQGDDGGMASKPFVDDALPDGFWASSDADSEQESLEHILWSSPSHEESPISESFGTTEPIEEAIGGVEFFVESENASETSISLTPSEVEDGAPESCDAQVEEVATTECSDLAEKKDDDDDFWGFSDSLDISWGTSPAVEKPVEPVAEEPASQAPTPAYDAAEPEDEADSPDLVVPAMEEKKPTSVDEIDFNDPNDLSSFFDFATSDDLGFAPRKKSEPKQKREKTDKEPKRAPEPERPEKKQRVERDSAANAPDAKEPRASRNDRRRDDDEIEEPREPRAPRSDRRRDDDEVEEPRAPRASRNDRRRDYDDEEEQPRAPRASRNDRRRDYDDEEEQPRAPRASRNDRRRDYDDEEEQPRAPRASRNDRRRDYDDEEEQPRAPRASRNDRRRDYDDEEEQPRESRSAREDRRRATTASSDSPKDADGARKPERILPSWDEAIGYVVNFNLSRRLHRGRGGK